MTNKCTLEEVVARTLQKEFVSLLDPNDAEALQASLQDASVILEQISSGTTDLLEVLNNGISSRSLRILSKYLQRTEDGRSFLAGAAAVAEAIQSTQNTVLALERLLEECMKAVDEIAKLAIPTIDDDAFEMALSSIPGIVESELIEILGGCK